MKFLGSKAGVIAVTVMSILCVAAVSIAINITIITFNRQNQLIKDTPEDIAVKEQLPVKITSVGRLKEYELYYNGVKLQGVSSYTTDKEEIYIPMDALLKHRGIQFKLFYPDDMVRMSVNGKELILELGKNQVIIGNEVISLKMPVIASNNHILVPAELLKHVDGLKATVFSDKSIVFINRNFDEKIQDNLSIRMLRTVNGSTYITDTKGETVFWSDKEVYMTGMKILPSINGSNYLLASSRGIGVITKEADSPEFPEEVPPYATLSVDGKYLYWVDKNVKMSYIYDMDRKKTTELGDYYFRVKNDDRYGYLLHGGDILYDYRIDKRYKRVSLTNTLYSGVYTFLERKGKVVLEGNTVYSPDKKKMIYYGRNKKCYIVNADGTKMVLLGDYSDAAFRWVNNQRVMMSSGSRIWTFTEHGKNKREVVNQWRMVGQAAQGEVFFTNGNILLCETEGKEKQIAELPWNCESVYATSASGPYIIIASGSEEGVFLLSGDEVIKLGTSSMFLRGMKNGEAFFDNASSIKFSPDNKRAAVFQRDDGYLTIKFADMQKSAVKKISLNLLLNNQMDTDKIRSKWVDDNRFLVCSPNKSWIVHCGEDIHIYEQDEPQDSYIQEILN